VPAGYYDREHAAWIASDSGLIVKIVGVTDRRADLDLDGDGQADDPAQLNISDAEREQLANRYPIGQQLWPVPLPHFPPWDSNWPLGPPEDAPLPNGGQPSADKPLDNPCQREGSIIECQNQTLGEKIDVVGTPFQLHYTSERVADHTASRALRIPLSGPSVPASLARIELEIDVAGRHFSQSFSNAPDQNYVFIWDRTDAFGRMIRAWHEVTAGTGFVSAGSYAGPTRFGYSGNGIRIDGNRTRQEITLWSTWHNRIGIFDAPGRGLGGWSLDVHHTYEANGQV